MTKVDYHLWSICLKNAKYIMCFALTPILLLCSLNPTLAEQSDDSKSFQTPTVCVSFNGDRHPHPWGHPNHTDCADGHAAFSVVRRSRNEFNQRHKVVNCCQLNSADILVDDHIVVFEKCPENYVVTSDTYLLPDCDSCDLQLRCTKINTKRYQLGPPTAGAYWGLGSNTWKMRHRYLKSDVPISFRYSLGRESEFKWTNQGCFGYPFGSLLTEAIGRECHQFIFRELQYKGESGDPAAGTPVEIFPSCKFISSPFDKNPRCVE